jgi:hypothetical protein
MLGRVPWPLAGALAGLLYLAVLHVSRVDGPGGLRALLGRIGPRDPDPSARGDVGELPADADAAVDDLAAIGLSTVPSPGLNAEADAAPERRPDDPGSHQPRRRRWWRRARRG